MEIPYFALLLATILVLHGLRKKSLSPGGAATAFFIGTLMMSGDTKVFGTALITFYLVGSRATRCKCQEMNMIRTDGRDQMGNKGRRNSRTDTLRAESGRAGRS